MKNMTILVVYMLAFLSLGNIPQTKELEKKSDPLSVRVCDLVCKPKLYDQKMVRVQGVYRYGLEWSELYCLECLDIGTIWVEFDESLEARTKKKIIKRVTGNGDKGRTVNVVFVGKYFGKGGGYGHLNTYSSKLQVFSVEKADVLLNDSPIPSHLPHNILSKIRCY